MNRTTAAAILCALLLAAGGAAVAAPADVHLPLDAPDARWLHVDPTADGVHGSAAHFADRAARVDAGPCPVSSLEPFTLRVHLRTTESGFCTPLMARSGEAVGISLVMGRAPGRISFEAWSWRSVRIVSRSRIDDGRWHEVEVPYDPASGMAILFVDGRYEGSAALGEGGSPQAQLRLGNNIGADQPYRGDLDEVCVLPFTSHADAFPGLAPVTDDGAKQAQLAAIRGRQLLRTSPTLEDPDAWPKRRAALRRDLTDALGLDPPPPRGPLDPRVHGEMRADGCRVQRVSWNSWPGYRATGWLWLPDPRPAGRLPAMLGPHGHWTGGAIDPVVQARAIRFARCGYVALMVDSVHVEDVAAGVSSLGAMTWDNVRAIDYLVAREDVDPARIGCTGASGGGQQTMVLMALEDRIAAAAPIVMACHFAEITEDRTAHCGCNHVARLEHLLDVPEMCAAFAPKPAFFGTVTGDWTHAFPQQGFPEILRLYASLGHAEAVSNVHRDEGHNYDRPFRELVYGFFDRAFGVTAPSDEGSVRTLALEDLRTLGAPAAPPDRAALAGEHVARRPRFSQIASAAPALPWCASARPIEDRGRRGPWRAATVTSFDGAEIPMLLRDGATGTDERWTIVDAADGKAALAADPPAWLARLPRVALVDPRFRGEWRAFADAWRRNGIWLGRGEGYEAAHDLAFVAESLPGAGGVTIAGLGEAGVEALLAAHVSSRIKRVVAPSIGVRFATDGNRLPLCPEILRFGDLPDLVRALRGPCNVEIGGADGPGDYAGGDRVTVFASASPMTEAEVARALDVR